MLKRYGQRHGGRWRERRRPHACRGDRKIQRLCLALFAACTAFSSAVAAPPIVGIDHIPVVVRNLETAADDYRDLGFPLKPGHLHDNSLRNHHVKFPDGSGIELITASEGRDALSKKYLDLLAAGEGPAFFALHARDPRRLTDALDAAHITYTTDQGRIDLADPALSVLFFIQDNRSPTDLPEHFAHPNTAVAMDEVWIATDPHQPLARLLTALGAQQSREVAFVPDPVTADVFTVENGKIILLPQSRQLIKGRSIVGAAFHVRDLAAARQHVSAPKITDVILGGPTKSRDALLVPPESTHGLWLQFHEAD